MTRKQLKVLLQKLEAELEKKKYYACFKDTICEGCGEGIEEGSDMVFVDGSKICLGCLEELIEVINTIHEQY